VTFNLTELCLSAVSAILIWQTLLCCEKRFVQWLASADELTGDVTRLLKATAHHVPRPCPLPHRARLLLRLSQ